MNDIPLEIIVSISEFLSEIFIHRTFPLMNKRWLELYPKCVRTLRLELKMHWERRLEKNRSIDLSSTKKSRLMIFLRDCNRIHHVDLSYVHVNTQLLNQIINTYSHSLKSIQIPGNKLVAPGFVKRLGAKCKQLKRIDVSFCHKLSKTMAGLLKSLPSSLDLIVVNDLSSITWEVLFEYSKSNPNSLLLGMHLMKSPLFSVRKFEELHTKVSREIALAYYDFALVYGYEQCCTYLFDFYRDVFPSLRAILQSIAKGTRGALHFLAKNDFSFKDEVPVDIIIQAMDSGHVQVLEVLRISHSLEHFMRKIDLETVENWIRKGRFDCVTQLRLGNFSRWNDVSLECIHVAVLNGTMNILNSLKELQYSKMEMISPEMVEKGILNGHSKFINTIPVSVIEKVELKELPRDIVRKIKHILMNKKRKK